MIDSITKTRIRSALRRIWLWSTIRNQVKSAARVKRGIYRCSKCAKLVNAGEIDIDHIVKVTPPGGINAPEDFGILIKNLFCGPEGLIALCKPCHKEKTREERNEAKKISNKKAKKRSTRRRKRTKRRRISGT